MFCHFNHEIFQLNDQLVLARTGNGDNEGNRSILIGISVENCDIEL